MITIMCLYCSILNAQPKIDGMGPFKIGKSLASLLPTYGDTSKGRLRGAEPEIPGTEMYYAGYYPIADMWIEDLKLMFYKDTLFRIECKSSIKLTEAVRLKYGTGIMKAKANVVNCITGLKIRYEESEKNYTISWPTSSKKIAAMEEMNITVDDHCQKNYSDLFSICNTETEMKVYAMMNKDHDAKKEAEEAKRKKALQSF